MGGGNQRELDGLHELIITMQQQRSDRQSRKLQADESEQESLQCRETLIQPFPSNSQNKVKHCGCKCRCNLQESREDPAEKRRQKRKESKKRQKERLKQAKEKALIGLQRIIRDIYALKISFRKAQVEIQQCLSVENNRQRLCEFINMVIRDEVEFIRKEIAFNLKKYDPIEEGKEHEAVRAVFQPIQRIAEASIEIEKLINIFMTNFSDQQETPLQKNFGRTTLKFLVKADLSKSGVFTAICSSIYQSPPEHYIKERELINYMTAAFESYHASHFSDEQSDSEEDTEDYVDYDEDDWEESSTIESPKNQLEEEEGQACKDKGKRKRKQRRRKLKEDIEDNFQAILKRTEQMTINEQCRAACNVSEECLERLKKRKWKYTQHELFQE